MVKHERFSPITRMREPGLNPSEKLPQVLPPLPKDVELAIAIGKKTVANNNNGCVTPILFVSMIVSSDLVPDALSKCGINSSEVLGRLEDYYLMATISAPNYKEGLSEGAFDALRVARSIANKQKAREVNSIHFLLGMLIARNNVVEGALNDLGGSIFSNISKLKALAKKAATPSETS